MTSATPMLRFSLWRATRRDGQGHMTTSYCRHGALRSGCRGSRIDKVNAPVAQGTEQRTSNPPVAGSNPAGRAVESNGFAGQTLE